MIGSLIAMAAVIAFIYQQRQRMMASGLSTVDYINEVLLKDHAILVLLTLVFINVAEAIYAASIPDTGIYINGISRFFTHFSVAFVSILMMLELPRAFVDFITRFGFFFDDTKIKKPEHWFLFIIQCAISGYVALAAFGIPILNYFTIASGLHQLDLAKYAIFELVDGIVFFYDFGLRSIYIEEGYASDFSPFNEMAYPLFAAFGMMISHLIFSSYDGLYALKRKLTRITLGEPENIGSGPTQAEIDRIQRDPGNAIKFLVRQAGNSRDRQKADEIANDAVSKWTGISDRNKKMDISRKIATLYRSWKNFEQEIRSGNMSESVKRNKRRRLVRQTLDFFRKSPNNKGLGRPLSNRRVP